MVGTSISEQSSKYEHVRAAYELFFIFFFMKKYF